MKPAMDARPYAEAVAEDHPVVGVVFTEGKPTERYFDEEIESAQLTGLRAMARRFFRR